MRLRLLGYCALALAAVGPQAAGAQVFLSTRPNPAFELGPLLVTATVTDAIAPSTPIRIVSRAQSDRAQSSQLHFAPVNHE